jgi:hypothetical protein
MTFINDNYLKLKAGYLFPEIGRRVKAFQQQHPDAKIIRVGIGDVTKPVLLSGIAAFLPSVAAREIRAMPSPPRAPYVRVTSPLPDNGTACIST